MANKIGCHLWMVSKYVLIIIILISGFKLELKSLCGWLVLFLFSSQLVLLPHQSQKSKHINFRLEDHIIWKSVLGFASDSCSKKNWILFQYICNWFEKKSFYTTLNIALCYFCTFLKGDGALLGDLWIVL